MAVVNRTNSEPSRDASIPWYSTLQFQFMMVSLGLIMVIMLIFSFVTVLQTGAVFEDQITKGGAALTNSVSVLARHYFDSLSTVKLHAEAREVQRKCEADLQKLLLTGSEQGIVGPFDVLNIFFVVPEKSDPFLQNYSTVTAVGQSAYNLTVFGGQTPFVAKVRNKYVTTDIMISEGKLEVAKTGESMAARIFEEPVLNDAGKPIATVYLILSAQRLREEQFRIVFRILIAFLISVVIAIVTSFVSARSITIPMTELVKDFQIVSGGNLDHRAHLRASNEIGYLARSFNEMTARLRAAHDAELAHKTREHEMKVATAIQESLLPKKIPQIQGYDIAAYYRPSREVGGDYYDFIEIGEKTIGIVVADVSGKGIPASMVMTMTRSVMRFAAMRNESPARTLREVNHTISGDLREGTFVTALFVLLHVDKKELVVSSAGHNPLLWLKESTGECLPVKPKGIALGLDNKGLIFDDVISEETLQLASGDKVFMYTDGIIEARNAEGEQFGKARLSDLLRRSRGYDSQTTMKMIVDAVSYHTGEAAQYDDITATLITVA